MLDYIIEIIGALIVIPFMIIESVFKLFLLITVPICTIIIGIVYPLIPNRVKILKVLNNLWKYSKKFKQGFYTGKLFQYWQVF